MVTTGPANRVRRLDIRRGVVRVQTISGKQMNLSVESGIGFCWILVEPVEGFSRNFSFSEKRSQIGWIPLANGLGLLGSSIKLE